MASLVHPVVFGTLPSPDLVHLCTSTTRFLTSTCALTPGKRLVCVCLFPCPIHVQILCLVDTTGTLPGLSGDPVPQMQR